VSVALYEQVTHVEIQRGDDLGVLASGKALQEYTVIISEGDGQAGFPVLVGRARPF
jgi:hypothetical protein